MCPIGGFFYEKNIRIDGISQITHDVKFALASDFHFKDKKDLKRFDLLFDQCVKFNPDYILLLGYLVNDASVKSDELRWLQIYLKELSMITKVYSVLGNHDQMTLVDGKWETFINEELIEKLGENITILKNNSVILEDGITLSGIDLDSGYYEKYQEDEDVYINRINSLNLGTLTHDIYSILLQHTPNNLFDRNISEKIDYLKHIDLAISGHLHNGCIPVYFDFLPTNRGFIGYKGSHLKLGLDNCRGFKKIQDNLDGIVLSPMKTFSDGYLEFMNRFYPVKEQYLVLKKQK